MSGLMTVEEAAPGDVEAVRSLGNQMRDTADAARQARDELRAIGGSCRTLPWEGCTADAFGAVVAEMPLDVDKLANGYDSVSAALLSYAGVLSTLRTRAGEHLRAGTHALGRLAVLRPRRASLAASMHSAMWAVRSAQGAQTASGFDPSPAGAQARAQADREAAAAHAHLARLQRELAAVDSEIAAEQTAVNLAKQGLQDVKDEARAAGRTAAAAVREAADNSWRDRGLVATLGSFADAAGVALGAVGAVLKGVTKTLMGVEAATWMAAVLRGAAKADDLAAKFVRQATDIPGFVKKALTAAKVPTRLISFAGRAASLFGRLAWPLTVVMGVKDLITGGGYDGWRGTMTKIMGAVGAAGGVVLGVAALAAAGVIGVTVAPVVLAGAGIAVAAYGLWSAGNAIVDNWDTIKGWGSSVKSGASSAWNGVRTGARSAGDSITKGIVDIGRGFASPITMRGLSVF